MRTKTLRSWGWALALALALPSTAFAELGVGDVAPDFTLPGSDGKSHSLSAQLEDSEGVVLAWFPKAFTPG